MQPIVDLRLADVYPVADVTSRAVGNLRTPGGVGGLAHIRHGQRGGARRLRRGGAGRASAGRQAAGPSGRRGASKHFLAPFRRDGLPVGDAPGVVLPPGAPCTSGDGGAFPQPFPHEQRKTV
jgi:hypothetical protein